jgi:hypothetical protein
MKKIWAYGDSFVAGDQDIPGRVDAILENMEYNRYQISFVSQLAKSLDRQLINRAISGCGNFVQLDKLLMDSPNINKGDLIIFGLTTTYRDRFVLPHMCPESISPTRGPTLLHRDLIFNEQLNKIAVIDLFYILSVIEKIENLFGFKVIKFNLFHDVLSEATEEDLKLFKFENFIGLNTPGNTIIDFLVDNWGVPEKRIIDHSKWKPPTEYSHLFTKKSHPSLEGHKLIAKWLENKLIDMGMV